jgi:hypothetical protein
VPIALGPGAALYSVALALGLTVAIETGVAALLGLRGRALAAVVWVNFVTNPLLNLAWLSIFWLGFGYKAVPSSPSGVAGGAAIATWAWLVLVIMEVIVVLSEWAILRLVVERPALSHKRLLTISLAMNAVSATLGTFVLTLLA